MINLTFDERKVLDELVEKLFQCRFDSQISLNANHMKFVTKLLDIILELDNQAMAALLPTRG